MYFRPHLICALALCRQPEPIFLPGSACGMPYAPPGLPAWTFQPLSRCHSFFRQVHCLAWVFLYFFVTSSRAIVFADFFLTTFFVTAVVAATVFVALVGAVTAVALEAPGPTARPGTRVRARSVAVASAMRP